MALSLTLGACSSDEGSEPDNQDDPNNGQANANNQDPENQGEPCDYQMDCGDDGFCFDGSCHASPECPRPSMWSNCADHFDDIGAPFAERAYCDRDHCQVACTGDQHCPSDHLCTDHGRCRPFVGELTGEHPQGSGGEFQAGIGQALLNFPVGLSLGGYGSRMSSQGGRYADSLRPSHGTMHGLDARAVALDDGDRQLLFMRAPIIFPTMAIHEAVARNLQAETGADWRSSLVISGTHTHSGPARHWQIPPDELTVGPGLGSFGTDEFHQQAFLWLVDSLSAAALDALDDLSPAQMGWEIVEAFDTDDVISRDRRGETPPFDDNRLLLLRIDHPDGSPRSLLFSFGTHGTIHDGDYATDDVIVGAESQLEYALGDAFDANVPVMYFNQNGGNMGPRGNQDGHSHTQRYDNLGHHLVERSFDAISTMETTDDWSLQGHTHRFPIDRDLLDYPDDQFSDYYQGGFQCGLGGDNGPSEPDDYGCIGFDQLLNHRPMTLIHKSQISAFRLNDLTLLTMPGELTMPLGWQVLKHLEMQYGIDPLKAFTWGYAQDHLLYLLPTNLQGDRPPFPGLSLPDGEAPGDYPDYTFSYLQGGYEASMSPWGHNLGDYLIARALEAVALMEGDELDLAFDPPFPDQFTPYNDEPFDLEATAADDMGTMTEEPPATVTRRQPIEVAWIGGDPGAEAPQTPQVTLERQNGDGDFEEVLLPNRQPYTNRAFTMLTRLRYTDADLPEWVIYWEESQDFALGTYRFRVDGHFLDDTTDERTPYQTTTEAFELVGDDLIELGDPIYDEDEEHLLIRLSYPAAHALDIERQGDDRAVPSGSYRMHHPHTPSGAPIPVDPDDLLFADAEITANGNALASISDFHFDDQSSPPITDWIIELNSPPASGDTLDLDLIIRDLWDNQTVHNTSIEIP